MSRSGIITLIVLLLLLCFAFITLTEVKKENKLESLEQSLAGEVLADTTAYTDVNGNKIDMTSYLGRPFVAVAWASWCPACVEQLKIASQVADERQDIKILAFNRAESQKTAKEFLTFYNLETNLQLVFDSTDNFYTSIQGQAMPESVIYNSRGEVVHHERDLFTKEEMINALEKIEDSN